MRVSSEQHSMNRRPKDVRRRRSAYKVHETQWAVTWFQEPPWTVSAATGTTFADCLFISKVSQTETLSHDSQMFCPHDRWSIWQNAVATFIASCWDRWTLLWSPNFRLVLVKLSLEARIVYASYMPWTNSIQKKLIAPSIGWTSKRQKLGLSGNRTQDHLHPK